MVKRLSDALSLPQGLLSGAPRVEMWGKNYVMVEGYKNIVRFEKDLLILKAKRVQVEIRGFELEITALSPSYIEIKGEILSVNMESGEGYV